MTTTVPAGVLAALLPPDVRCAEAFGALDVGRLHPSEAAYIRDRSPRRRQQFTTARTLARRALAELGHPPTPLLPGPGGAPQWPSGAAGSITHTDGYTACAVTSTGRHLSLGIDAEAVRPLPHGVLELVSSAEERRGLDGLPVGTTPWDTVLFSAKEAVYKAVHPLTRTWTALAAIVVAVHADGTFTAAHPHHPVLGTGRWGVRRGVLITALALPPTG
ncbi:4'-phosphopantetheinyl transferase [Kitasatospora xanthocidica]|uniref:4'-phosphopantetheinyl transferase family protein n=1 Tax=Kitasatospora xanthocidica TaxID=83382 RepID=UPI001674C29A|nr:4'-phosphopantetheinyl transferase superfamily protein [Kitasatospora xanthocidica]GHF67908.1 4'-phosphopantetheinyl transferase [Kitasatospora xanthocidica]